MVVQKPYLGFWVQTSLAVYLMSHIVAMIKQVVIRKKTRTLYLVKWCHGTVLKRHRFATELSESFCNSVASR